MSLKIDELLVRRLIATQIPQWKDFSVRPVTPGGWDNRTFHLGDQMLVRLPTAARYASKIEKEFRWLPILAPLLPHEIPVPLVMGEGTQEYPWRWGVYRWLAGETVASTRTIDLNSLARTLAEFLNALYVIDPTGGPPPGPDNFYRGGSLEVYDAEVRQAVTILKDRIDGAAVTELWNKALATGWQQTPVWVHGDIAAGNMLIQEGQLSGVIDFGGLAIGDPACDVAIAWTLFTGESRELFRNSLSLDEETWTRGCAWALWKALIIAAGMTQTSAIEGEHCWRIIDEVLADHKRKV